MFYWNQKELNTYLEYQKYSNLFFIHIWEDLDIDLINSYLIKLEAKMCIYNKFVNIFKKNNLIEIVRFNDIEKIESQYEDLLIWVPINFKNKKEMLYYLMEEFKKII
jgi:hypothetical protein